MDKISVNQMQFFGYHGVFPEETKLGQRFIVDLDVFCDLQEAGMSDDLNYSINYAELYTLSKEVVEGEPYQVIEAVAESIASKVLETFSRVIEVRVKVIKPDPPIPGHYQSVSVEITRGR
ncbi:dihydroneopterin aldolase [Bacillus sp. CGMCC 1.16607]|uniref:dihydroneopterin aldolase n=1 Tax=Bacillus sp. CGMCC 1.16607 TaxID=3351842 RepID=UPI003643D007